jgi:hypothetical protein
MIPFLFFSDVFPAVWAIESWLLLFSEVQDACPACWAKCYRQYSNATFSPAFSVEIEWTSTNTTLSKGFNLIR